MLDMSIPMGHDSYMSILRDARERIGISRELLAREASTSTSTLTRMEREGHIPSGATVARIAAVLGITADTLLSPSTPIAPAADLSPRTSAVGASSVSEDAA